MANNATKLASIKFYKAASLAEDLSRRIMTASARLQAASIKTCFRSVIVANSLLCSPDQPQ